ncbi:MAG TPA: sugar-binding protein, partial [Nitrospira sp.]|nr:sugar-binding protein [Nitrospira sp.]
MTYIPRISRSLGILLLSAGACLADRATLDETKTQFALPMATPPTIDGVVEAGEWGQAAGANNNWRVFVRNVTDQDGNVVPTLFGGSIGDGANAVPADDADLSYQIFAGYDADYLYVAVKVRDSVVVTDSAVEGSANGTTWMDDSVEVFVDGDNSNYPNRDTSGTNPGVVGSGGQFVITANNAYRDAEAGNPGYGDGPA